MSTGRWLNNMEIRVKNREMLFKCLATLSVFSVCFLTPIFAVKLISSSARNSIIKMDMSTLRNWAEVYKVKNANYGGMSGFEDTQRVVEDIEKQGGSCRIFEDGNHYCAVASLNDMKGHWCIDDAGYIGREYSGCTGSGSYNCK
jgi:hypothetical protein